MFWCKSPCLRSRALFRAVFGSSQCNFCFREVNHTMKQGNYVYPKYSASKEGVSRIYVCPGRSYHSARSVALCLRLFPASTMPALVLDYSFRTALSALCAPQYALVCAAVTTISLVPLTISDTCACHSACSGCTHRLPSKISLLQSCQWVMSAAWQSLIRRFGTSHLRCQTRNVLSCAVNIFVFFIGPCEPDAPHVLRVALNGCI